MNLFREICEVLDAAAVKYTTETVCGYDVLLISAKPAAHAGSDAARPQAAVIPVSITAPDLETAMRDADALQDVTSQVVLQKGLYPLTIAEDRWRSQQQMMRSRLLAHTQIFTQIYARNCEVRKIDRLTAGGFLSANHSYGDAKCRYCYGLYLKRYTGHTEDQNPGIEPGTLVAVATFSNARKWIKADKTIRSYEWTRYASLPGVRLSGGMGKLLKAFIEEVRPDDIMTYADLEWSEGKVYEALGFVLEGQKEAVGFVIDSSWKRLPAKPAMTGKVYFRNLGSNKYRLKLTDYQ